jgi:molybdopterin adenylyltransferase
MKSTKLHHNSETPLLVGVVTVSDRASQGEYVDRGGPALKAATESHGWRVEAAALVPDDKSKIQDAIRSLTSQGCQVILTTGGTGVGFRDVTPEAVREIAIRELPGFGEAMRMGSLKSTPLAICSRCLAAVVEKTLVICLPGKPSGAVECLTLVADAVPHCVEVLQDLPHGEADSHGQSC